MPIDAALMWFMVILLTFCTVIHVLLAMRGLQGARESRWFMRASISLHNQNADALRRIMDAIQHRDVIHDARKKRQAGAQGR